MSSLLKTLKDLNPEFMDLTVQEIGDEEKTVGFQCFVRNLDGSIFAGGTSQQKYTAIRIAVAEAFERSFFRKIILNPVERDKFLIDQFPSTSGFAFGFNEKQTRFRAICEGLERWAWSKWIDEGFQLLQFTPEIPASALTKHLLKSFSETYWFRKSFKIEINNNESMELCIVIFLGCTDNGIFPGSRVSMPNDNLLEHPVIEAHRNYTNSVIHQISPLDLKDIIQERTIFFSSNKKIALDQIKESIKSDWPTPKIYLLQKHLISIPNLFLYRCLFEDFIGWHEGDVTRFVY